MTSTQRLFQSPKPIHRLHHFTRQDRLFIVDLDVGQILEADDLIWEILQLCPESTQGKILETLSERYAPDRIYQAFEQLCSFEEMGLLVGNTGREVLQKKNRPESSSQVPLKRGHQIKHTLGVDTVSPLKKFSARCQSTQIFFSMPQNRRSFQTEFTPFPQAPQDTTFYSNFSKTKLMEFSYR